ncbi:MAG: glycosyltransferase family 4 protein [Eubacteriales bacterium]|nr:glycosyltransferase family 4 protein [Eubacteriales bacterium]
MEKSVLVLGNSDSGLCDFRTEVLEALMREGFTVHVSVPDTGYVSRLCKLGCICHETKMERRGMNPAKDARLLLFYCRLIRRIRPEAVLTYTIKPNVYGGVACRLTGTAYLANVTGLGTALEHGGLLRRLIVLLYRAGLSGAACVFFQNEQNLRFMREADCLKKKTDIRVIPGSGVNLQAHPPRPYPEGEQVRFVSVMRIMEDKGIGELLEAARRIHKRHPETVFELLGSYEEETRARYEPLIQDLQAEGIVRYYGYRDDMPRFYEGCQAVIHPSYHEGMSNVLQEAAATARPVLASDISGCREIFEDGVSGIAFAPKDADSLERAVEKFLSLSWEQRRQMGQRAREYVEKHFDRRQVVQAYLETLRSLKG